MAYDTRSTFHHTVILTSVAMSPFHFARVLPALVGVFALAAPGGPAVPLGYAGDGARQDFAGSSSGQS